MHPLTLVFSEICCSGKSVEKLQRRDRIIYVLVLRRSIKAREEKAIKIECKRYKVCGFSRESFGHC